MGCDGGVIATQRKFTRIKVVRRDDEPEREEVQKVQWTTCALSGQLLKEPIVMCELGFIYNKEAIMEALLSKQLKGTPFAHVHRLKDVAELHFEENPHYTRAVRAGNDTSEISHYICPLSKMEVKGPYKFSALWNCGCVFSARALREVAADATECQRCGKPCDSKTDIIPLNGSKDELDELRRRMEMKRLMRADKSKEKKKKGKDKGKGKEPAVETLEEGKQGVDYRMIDEGSSSKSQQKLTKRPRANDASEHRDKRHAASSDVMPPIPLKISDAKFKPTDGVKGSIFTSDKPDTKHGYNVLTR